MTNLDSGHVRRGWLAPSVPALRGVPPMVRRSATRTSCRRSSTNSGSATQAVPHPYLVKVADDDPMGLFGERAGDVVFERLFKRRLAAVSRLRRVEVLAARLVFYEDARFGNPRIEILCRVLQLDRHLVLDARLYVGHAQNLAEKRVPELLVLAFLASALERPVFHELPRGLSLRCSHGSNPLFSDGGLMAHAGIIAKAYGLGCKISPGFGQRLFFISHSRLRSFGVGLR